MLLSAVWHCLPGFVAAVSGCEAAGGSRAPAATAGEEVGGGRRGLQAAFHLATPERRHPVCVPPVSTRERIPPLMDQIRELRGRGAKRNPAHF